MFTLLQELLNASAEFEITSKSADDFRAEATIDGRHIVFLALRTPPDGKWPEDWFIEFFDEAKDGERDLDLNGKGSEFKIFPMVIAAFHKFIDLYHPNLIKFQGVGKRKHLYAKLLKRMNLADYSIDEDDGHPGTTHFELTKKT